MIRRHSLSAVCMHWFNAFCWIALLFTGFALLSNPECVPDLFPMGCKQGFEMSRALF